MQIKAITLQQPWAWAVAKGHKRVENRPARTFHRGPLAIIAGKGADWLERGLAFLRSQGIEPPPEELVAGYVVAITNVTDCVEFDRSNLFPLQSEHLKRLRADPFATGPQCYLLDNTREMSKPFPCRGNQVIQTIEIPDNYLPAALVPGP